MITLRRCLPAFILLSSVVAAGTWIADAAPPQQARGGGGGGGGAARQPPPDLRTLLAAPQSEMIIVTQRYNADRSILSRFYTVSITPLRTARMKRFEMDWQAALDKLDASKLTPVAQGELQQLKSTVQRNLQELDRLAAAQAQIRPFVPFAPMIIKLEESRRQMESMDAQKAAVQLAETVKQVNQMRATVQAALADNGKLAELKINRDLAMRSADAIDGQDGLMPTLRAWFEFYNLYDPMFTWWMATAYKEINQSLSDYASLLRDRVAGQAGDQAVAAVAYTPIQPSEPLKYAEVPDLQMLVSLPQNELRTVLQRFQADVRGGGRRGGGGGRGAGGAGAAARAGGGAGDGAAGTAGAGEAAGAGEGAAAAAGAGGVRTGKEYYQSWLNALKQIDFDKLSRNAQVDYLHMRNTLDVEILRADKALPQPAVKMDSSGINGRPVGHDSLVLDLEDEMVPYTPEQLLVLAEKEFAWCEVEMKKASHELGFGDDWKKAVEHAKDGAVPAGKQPDLIRDLMRRGVDYLRTNELIDVEEIDAETLRMEMMSPERQLVNPFFTGGTLISVSYPTNGMSTEAKIESMRGNNPGFSAATVHHELIPGHNMQGYITQRYGNQRGGFSSTASSGGTAFYGEGWAVYWEMLFYARGYPKNPDEKVGFMFWRMHRAARIVFSMSYHLGRMTAQECIDYLVDKVGHERENATAEVRRSFTTTYGSLYQAGYMLGALQFREMHKELVESGQMSDREFHDAVLRQGSMPVSLVRLALNKQKLTADMPLDWKFYGEVQGK